MMKIKIIDLLNNIYNQVGVPKKIKFDNHIWIYREEFQDYQNENYQYLTDILNCNFEKTQEILNIEVEIAEESKKIEKITMFGEEFKFGTMKEYLNYYKDEDNEVLICRVIDGMAIMFNKVIDEVNKLKENK